jgi:energy-coupling factor transporter ATP-binding protein EcfA2
MSGSYATSGFPEQGELNPFPGLRAFEAEEDYLFFGRERQTDDLLRKLRTTRFLSILGRSGSGKSSLVRSGLIPALWGGGMTAAGSQWRVVIMRPGEDPMASLAKALTERGALFDDVADQSLTAAFFETTLRASDRGLLECVRQARLGQTSNVLVLVDQFEELFRYKRSRRIVGRDEAAAFVKLLLTARQSDVPIYIAITMRSDFIGDCMEFGNLPEVINQGIYLVPRMTRDELKSAITGPVAVGGGTIAPRLVSRLLNDVGDDPDQLPILQHALMRTWDRRLSDPQPGEPLDLRHYEAIGGLQTALSRHAEEAFGELDTRQQQIAEKLFKALTDKASDSRGVRRPASLMEICGVAGATAGEVASVVETFRKPGRSFLMPPAGVPLQPSSIIDISHESLMRIWERLSTWAEEEARSGQLYLNAARAAQRHEEGVAALWRDPELQLALSWRESMQPTATWASRYDPAFDRAMAFIDASRDERDQELREREERRRQRLRQARRLIMVLSAASVITLALGAYAFVQERKAHEETVRAEDARNRAEIAQKVALRERDRATKEKERAELERGRALTEQQRAQTEKVRADERSLFAQTQRRIADTERLKAEANEHEAKTQRAVAETAQQQAVAEKQAAESERQKAERSEAQTLRLSHIAAARALALTIPQQKDESQRERSAVLALEAYRLNRDNHGELEDPDLFGAMRSALDRLAPPPVIGGNTASIRALALSPDGRTAFSGAEDGAIRQIDLEQRKASPLAALAGPVRAIAVAPGGNLLAAGTSNGEIRLWNPRDAAAPARELGDGKSVITALAASRDLLAAGALDGSVRLWKLADAGSAPVTVRAPAAERVMAVAFNGDGTMLAAGLTRGGALVWNAATPSAAPRAACVSLDVRSLSFSPDGKALACGSSRGQIVQESLGGTTPTVSLAAAHRSSVNSISYDKRGRFLASASSDGTVRLWEAGKRDTQPIVLPGHESWVWGLAFQPSGDRLISGGEDRTVRIWPARAEVLAADLCRAVGSTAKKELTPEEWSKYMPADQPYRRGSPCAAIDR